MRADKKLLPGILATLLLPVNGLISFLLALLTFGGPGLSIRSSLFWPTLVCISCLALSALFAPYPPKLFNVDKTTVETANLLNRSDTLHYAWGYNFDPIIFKGELPDKSNGDVCVYLPPHRFMVRGAESQVGDIDIVGSVYIRSSDEKSVAKQIDLRIEDGGSQGGQRNFALSEEWQRIEHHEFFPRPSQTGTVFLRLSNEKSKEPIGICVWGAQLEFGKQATTYLTTEDAIERKGSTWLERAGAVTALALGGLLTLLAIGGWGAIWSRLGSRTPYYLFPGFILITLIGIGQKLWTGTATLDRAVGLTFSPNLYAAQVLTLGVIILAFSRSLPINIMTLMLSLLSIWASGSRGAAIVLIVTLVLIASLYLKERYRLGVALTLATVAISIIFAVFPGVLGHLNEFNSFNRDPRIEAYKASVKIITERPLFGWGVGSSSDQIYRVLNQKEKYAHTHNLFLQILVEFGFVGLSGVVYLLYSMSATVIRLRAWLIAPALLVIILTSTYDFLIGQSAIYAIVLMAFGYIIHLEREHDLPSLHEARIPI